MPTDAKLLHLALGESVAHLSPWIPWATPHAPTLKETRVLLKSWIEQRNGGTNFIYAMFERVGSRLVGGIGFYARVGPARLEIGYWLRQGATGLGYATEATRAMVAAGFALPAVAALEIHIDPSNRASMRIPEKLGFRRMGSPPIGEEVSTGHRETVVFLLDRMPLES